MRTSFRRLSLPDEMGDLVDLLCGHEWPFHGTSRLAPSDVGRMEFLTADVDSYWIMDANVRDRDARVGLIRLLDLGDVLDGSPMFDIRIAAPHRGRGSGSAAVGWLTSHLFDRFDDLHRIEASTRVDNLAMRRVLDRCGYRLEGQLREAWRSSDGARSDALIYGVLRAEWTERRAEGEA